MNHSTIKLSFVIVITLLIASCGGGSDESTSDNNGSSSNTGNTPPVTSPPSPPAPSPGQVTVNWSAPSHNTDNSLITDLAGFKISWGPGPGNYPNSYTLNNPLATSYTVTGLVSGNYTFAVQAVDTSGNLSVYSASQSMAVP